MKRAWIVGVFAVLAGALMSNSNVEGVADKDKKEEPKYTIKEVMKEAHKSGLFKKIQKGDADKADREKLAELYKALALSEPAKGDKELWKKTTSAMLKVATDAIADAEAGKKLKVDCGACHKAFK
jgi:Na+-translocating ferredoxin:NAD+ oxidoreductase RnfG subunit